MLVNSDCCKQSSCSPLNNFSKVECCSCQRACRKTSEICNSCIWCISDEDCKQTHIKSNSSSLLYFYSSFATYFLIAERQWQCCESCVSVFTCVCTHACGIRVLGWLHRPNVRVSSEDRCWLWTLPLHTFHGELVPRSEPSAYLLVARLFMCVSFHPCAAFQSLQGATGSSVCFCLFCRCFCSTYWCSSCHNDWWVRQTSCSDCNCSVELN